MKRLLIIFTSIFTVCLIGFSATTNSTQKDNSSTKQTVETKVKTKESPTSRSTVSSEEAAKQAEEERLAEEASAKQAEESRQAEYNAPSNGITGYCKDGTLASGDPSARGKANSCYGHGGWVR